MDTAMNMVMDMLQLLLQLHLKQCSDFANYYI